MSKGVQSYELVAAGGDHRDVNVIGISGLRGQTDCPPEGPEPESTRLFPE